MASVKVAGQALEAVLGPAAVALEVLDGWDKLQDLYGMYKTGELPEAEYKQKFGVVVGAMGGARRSALPFWPSTARWLVR